MRELDVVLQAYLEHEYSQVPPDTQQAFRDVLELPDPTLINLILGRETTDDATMGAVIQSLQTIQERR